MKDLASTKMVVSVCSHFEALRWVGLKNKVIYNVCIIILLGKSNINLIAFYLQLIQKFLQWIIDEKSDFYFR